MLNENLTFEQLLHKRLFNSSYYSVDLLPRNNKNGVINVLFGFELVKIVDVVSQPFILQLPTFSLSLECSVPNLIFQKLSRMRRNVEMKTPKRQLNITSIHLSILTQLACFARAGFARVKTGIICFRLSWIVGLTVVLHRYGLHQAADGVDSLCINSSPDEDQQYSGGNVTIYTDVTQSREKLLMLSYQR